MSDRVFQIIEEKKLVPVVKLDNATDAVPLGEALIRGGLPVAEVTFRTDAAEESIRRMRRAFPDMLVGAGTVVSIAQAERALEAGAEFLVTPGTDTEILQFATDRKIPIFPGVSTATEIMAAMRYGIRIVKFFPAVQYGGLKTIKALAAPFPDIRFMPTGGINEANVREYLAYDRIIACGGSWMVKDALIREGKYGEITNLTRAAMEHIAGED